jgi:hypothetical protein
MATAAILKKSTLKGTTSQAYDIPTRFHKVWSRHLREKWGTKLCGKWNTNKNNNNNNNNKKRSKHNMSPKLRLEDIIIYKILQRQLSRSFLLLNLRIHNIIFSIIHILNIGRNYIKEFETRLGLQYFDEWITRLKKR